MYDLVRLTKSCRLNTPLGRNVFNKIRFELEKLIMCPVNLVMWVGVLKEQL